MEARNLYRIDVCANKAFPSTPELWFRNLPKPTDQTREWHKIMHGLQESSAFGVHSIAKPPYVKQKTLTTVHKPIIMLITPHSIFASSLIVDMKSHVSLPRHERQAQVHRLIEERERITVSQICQKFSVSEATARRDLDALAERGDIRRVRGGAVLVRKAPPEPPVLLRTVEQAECKRRIGQKAAELVSNGETVFLGSGTTVLEVANHLKTRCSLTVITNSLLVVDVFKGLPQITLIGLGGLFRHSEMSFIGHVTEQALSEFRADKVIMGIRALDPEVGLTNDYLAETRTDRAALQIGRRSIIVADHTKCGRVSTVFVAPITAVDTLVTDSEIPLVLSEAFTSKGVRIIIA